MIVERTDFISVPVTDLERSTRFYEETLGLPKISAGGWPEFQLGENISLYLIDPANIGQPFAGPHTTHIALRVADVSETRGELRVLLSNQICSELPLSNLPPERLGPSATSV